MQRMTGPNARRDRIGIRTRMPQAAASVHSRAAPAREANMRAFRAPDRTLAASDRDGRASECLAGRNDRGEKEQAEHRRFRNADDRPIQTRGDRKKYRCEVSLKERALGETAAGRRARGPVGQPSSGKEAEPSALRGPR